MLIVKYDEKRRRALATGLADRGYNTMESQTGAEAISAVESFVPMAMVYAWPLDSPAETDKLIRRLRSWDTRQVFIAVTADVSLEVAAYEAGADYCLVRPYNQASLYAQLEAGLRKVGWANSPNLLVAGDVTIDPAGRRAWRNGVELKLTATQFRLLVVLVQRKDEVVSPVELLEQCRTSDYRTSVDGRNLVEAHIAALRKKLHNPGVPIVENVRSCGYVLRTDNGRGANPGAA